MHSLAVSVIIPALNAEQHLKTCLAALRRQSLPFDQFEIIVVDNGSTDNTCQVATSFSATLLVHPGIRVGALRNRGAVVAKGAVLAFLDSDCIPEPNWLERGLESLAQHPSITGAPYETPPDANWLQRAWFSQRKAGRRESELINSGNLFVPKAIFHTIGGFDETLQSGEDAEFCLRAKQHTSVVIDDRIRVVHLGNPNTLGEFCRRELWYGLGALGSAKLNLADKPLIGTLLFLLFTLMQCVGILSFFLGASHSLLLISTLLVIGLVVLTVFYRGLQYQNWQHALPLALLYYLYYASRSLALVYALREKHYYHRT